MLSRCFPHSVTNHAKREVNGSDRAREDNSAVLQHIITRGLTRHKNATASPVLHVLHRLPCLADDETSELGWHTRSDASFARHALWELAGDRGTRSIDGVDCTREDNSTVFATRKLMGHEDLAVGPCLHILDCLSCLADDDTSKSGRHTHDFSDASIRKPLGLSVRHVRGGGSLVARLRFGAINCLSARCERSDVVVKCVVEMLCCLYRERKIGTRVDVLVMVS